MLLIGWKSQEELAEWNGFEPIQPEMFISLLSKLFRKAVAVLNVLPMRFFHHF